LKEIILDAEFEGHKIRAITKVSYFYFPIEISGVLEIDGKEVITHRKKRSFFDSYYSILATYSFNGTEREVEIRIARKIPRWKFEIVCQILIDGNQIGGDKAIYEELLKKGFFRYFISVGLLQYGLPFTILVTLFNDITSHYSMRGMAFLFVFRLFSFGLIMAYLNWVIINRISRKMSNKSIQKDCEKLCS
jgi:hypothetical protein